RQFIEIGAADGAQQHRVALQASVQRVRREGAAAGAVGGASKGLFLELEVVPGKFGHSLQYAHGFCRDLRADTVTRENCDSEFHWACLPSASVLGFPIPPLWG